jgi:hypothetical protein
MIVAVPEKARYFVALFAGPAPDITPMTVPGCLRILAALGDMISIANQYQ